MARAPPKSFDYKTRPGLDTQAEFRKMISSDKKKWAEVAKQAGIRVQ